MKRAEQDMERQTDGIWKDMIEELKRKIRAGDILTYRRDIKAEDGQRLIEEAEIKVRVKEKFPHLVWVEEAGADGYPIKTMTYAEILMDMGRKKEGREENIPEQ